MFELIFFGALALASTASVNRIPATVPTEASPVVQQPTTSRLLHSAHHHRTGHEVVRCSGPVHALHRTGIGLFSTYVLVSFMKESKEGTEAGMKYFIVSSVASGVGLYGLSLLTVVGLASVHRPRAGLCRHEAFPHRSGHAAGRVWVQGQRSAVPFAAPDAHAGATAPVAGSYHRQQDVGFFSASCSSSPRLKPPMGQRLAHRPRRALGHHDDLGQPCGAGFNQSQAHARLFIGCPRRCMLAAITAIGALNWEEGHVDMSTDAALVVVTALIFHLTVLVCFKLGAFLVLSLLESEEGGHTLESLGGLAKREPFIAVAMFIFMMSLAGVPPLSGFVSKLLVIMGIVKVALLDVTVSSDLVFGDVHWVWHCLLMQINSAITGLLLPPGWTRDVFHEFEEGREGPLASGTPVRMAIILFHHHGNFGVGAGQLIKLVESAANALVGAW